jgi:hypothetical protein
MVCQEVGLMTEAFGDGCVMCFVFTGKIEKGVKVFKHPNFCDCDCHKRGS